MNFPDVKSYPTRDVEQLYPVVKAKALALVAECKKAGIPIVITQTYRSHEYQAELHKKLGKGAAPAGKSMHEFRCAWDICINSKTDAYNVDMLKKVAVIAKKLGITCGADFPNVDRPHFQYTGGFTEDQIRAGKIPTK